MRESISPQSVSERATWRSRLPDGAGQSSCRPHPPQDAPDPQQIVAVNRFFHFWKSANLNSPRKVGQIDLTGYPFGCKRVVFAGFGLGAWRCLRTGRQITACTLFSSVFRTIRNRFKSVFTFNTLTFILIELFTFSVNLEALFGDF